MSLLNPTPNDIHPIKEKTIYILAKMKRFALYRINASTKTLGTLMQPKL